MFVKWMNRILVLGVEGNYLTLVKDIGLWGKKKKRDIGLCMVYLF